MKRISILLSFLLACFISLSAAMPALAFPPLPSSLYGTVKFNGGNAPDGTLIRALIRGQVYAYGYTVTYQGDSVYGLDIPGDGSSTPEIIEGGVEGDTIRFEVGGVIAAQSGTWHTGTNINLNLTATSANPLPLNTPTPTGAPVPTPTAIPMAQLSPTPAPSAAASTDNSSSTGLLVVGALVVAAVGAIWIVRRRG
jgi:hypothetical protein